MFGLDGYAGIFKRPTLILHSSTAMILLKNTLFWCCVVLCFTGGKSHDACLPFELKNSCHTKENQSAIVCMGGLPEHFYQTSDFIKMASLHCWPNESFDPYDVLPFFPKIEKFTLSRSETTTILKDFPPSSTLKELNITFTSIEFLEVSVFLKLNSLEVLDLRHNKLRIFNPSFTADIRSMEAIYLAGNPYSCGDNFSWITFENSTFNKLVKDVDEMICGTHRFNGKPLKRVMEIVETLKSECRIKVPANCTCVLDHVIRVSRHNLRPMIIVNCTHQQMTTLPSQLPNSTTTLIMRGNMISNLSEFITNESYSKLLNVYLDYNNISSINTLFVSSWLTTFRALSLKGNHLSEMPLFALENIFEKNRNVGKFLLSENPWRCDCEFTPLFKNFLVTYRSIIKDAGNVKCAAESGDKNSLVSIISLHRKNLCSEKMSHLSFMNFLSICFSILLFILLTDFARNYYMYKKYSKLPWIAKKLPF
ncbi:protein singed wings 2 isoform X1 [Planococcus citri]|uniref:protein singed wings 2 isoform X1 n=1 Tax=Planococcus citri TaxID=170843 RepID=UPI0031F8B01C